MSEPRLRIRVTQAPADASVAGFLLDAPLTAGETLRFARGEADLPPLPSALLALPGVQRIEVAATTIWVRIGEDGDWTALKSAVAAAIRAVMTETDAPLGAGAATPADPDARLMKAVEGILREQVNPSVAAHGGSIEAIDVRGGTLRLRMTGGCQGCAASAATLRQGVERILRAALPELGEIIDVTDHAAGEAPYLERGGGRASPLVRPLPPGTVAWEGERIIVDPAYLAPRLGLSPDALQEGLRSGAVVGVTERGEGRDLGKTRVVMRSAQRAWAAEVHTDGSAFEVPPPAPVKAASDRETGLVSDVRMALMVRGDTITYGALARQLGLWAPGSVGRITRALEETMREDAAAGRPLIAARAVSRAGGLPGRGFFDLAEALGVGPVEGESDEGFHARMLDALAGAKAAISG